MTLLGLTRLGLRFWIDLLQPVLVYLGVGGDHLSDGESTAILVPLQVSGVLPAATCFAKRKPFAGLVGLFVPAVALAGAVRLARPESAWARRPYASGKLDRARSRYAAAG